MQPLSLQLITPPAAEPVSLSQAKSQLRVDFDDDDALIGGYITAARQYVEKWTRRAIYNQTWLRTMDMFPLFGLTGGTISKDYSYWGPYWNQLAIDLPKPRTVSVTSITYMDQTGTVQTLPPTAYVVDTVSQPGRIVPSVGYSWPTATTYVPGAVQITYVAGSYGDGVLVDNCPQTIKLAMMLLISHWYQNRESVSDQKLTAIPYGVQSLLEGERIDVRYR